MNIRMGADGARQTLQKFEVNWYAVVLLAEVGPRTKYRKVCAFCNALKMKPTPIFCHLSS